jgi:hypothetical protein
VSVHHTLASTTRVARDVGLSAWLGGAALGWGAARLGTARRDRPPGRARRPPRGAGSRGAVSPLWALPAFAMVSVDAEPARAEAQRGLQ